MASLTAFTAGNALFEAVVARGFSVSDSGGNAVNLTGNNAKMKTSMGSSLVTDMRISSTATLTAGTRTLDASAMASVNFTVTTTAIASQLQGGTLLFSPDGNEWPLVLVQNEGFIIRATVPATGTWTGYIQIRWEEVTAFP